MDIKEDQLGFYLKLIDLNNNKIILHNKLYDDKKSAYEEAEKIRNKSKLAVSVYEVYKASRPIRFYPSHTNSYEDYSSLNDLN